MHSTAATEPLPQGYAPTCQARDYERIWTHYDDEIIYDDHGPGTVNDTIEATKKFFVETMSGPNTNRVVIAIHTTDGRFGPEGHLEGVHDIPGVPLQPELRGALHLRRRGAQWQYHREPAYWDNHGLLRQLGLR